MHILIIRSYHFMPERNSLLGIFQFHQASALIRNGCKIGLISNPMLYLPFRKSSEKLQLGKVIERDFGFPVLEYNGYNFFPKLRGLQRILLSGYGNHLFKVYCKKYGKPDILHAHNARSSGVLASQLKKNHSIPYGITEHSTAYATGWVNKIEFPFLKNTYQHADFRIFVSPELGNTIETLFGKDVIRPWVYIPNILDHLFENADLHPPLSKPRFTFLVVANLIERKGLIELLSAFKILIEDGNDCSLHIIGNGPQEETLKKKAVDTGIEDRVSFLGKILREQILREMQTCDVYLQPSYYETFGVAIIEALSCGKPVIATSSGGPNNIVNQDNGILIPPVDISALADAMRKMKDQIRQFNPIKIREQCISLYGEKAVTESLIKIYKEV